MLPKRSRVWFVFAAPASSMPGADPFETKPMSEIPDDEEERTTAQGFFNYADSYLGVAHVAWTAQPQVTFPQAPVRFLLYHAAELHLKAFLRCAGVSVSDLKAVGHKFTGLIKAARTSELGLSRDCEDVLVYGQRTRDVIESRYIRTGYRRWYETVTLGRCAALVRRTVRLHPLRSNAIELWGERAEDIDDLWERAWGLR